MAEVICRASPADRPYEEQHEWTSIAVVLGGTFTYRSSRGRALLVPGSLLLGESGTCFECGHEHGTGDRCVAFQFAPDFVDDAFDVNPNAREARFRTASIPPLEILVPLLAEVRSLAAAPNSLRAEQLAIDLAVTALALDGGATEPRHDRRDEARAAQAVQIIEAEYAGPLTIAGLARDVGMERRRFASAFRRIVGVTPYNYILSRRLDAAAARLRADQSSVLDICLDVGFGDLAEFTRRFRAKFGWPPALYRRCRSDARADAS